MVEQRKAECKGAVVLAVQGQGQSQSSSQAGVQPAQIQYLLIMSCIVLDMLTSLCDHVWVQDRDRARFTQGNRRVQSGTDGRTQEREKQGKAEGGGDRTQAVGVWGELGSSH